MEHIKIKESEILNTGTVINVMGIPKENTYVIMADDREYAEKDLSNLKYTILPVGGFWGTDEFDVYYYEVVPVGRIAEKEVLIIKEGVKK